MKKMIVLAVLAMGFVSSAHAENLLCFENGQAKTQGEFYQDATQGSRHNRCVMAVLLRQGADEVRIYEDGRRSSKFATNANYLQIRFTALAMGCQERICNGNMDINVGAGGNHGGGHHRH